jgi:hypothetical protein
MVLGERAENVLLFKMTEITAMFQQKSSTKMSLYLCCFC